MRDGPGWTHWYLGSMELELFRSETEGYRENLGSTSPQVYVVARPSDDAEGIEPFLVTVCPFEAQDYMDSGEEIVDAVLMPDLVIGFVKDFIDRHHVDEPFKKRKRRDHRRESEKFARPPDWSPGDAGRDGSQ